MLGALRSIPEGARQLVAFLCLLAASAVGSLTYQTQFLWFFSREVSYVPDLVAGVVALALIRPILSGDLNHNHRVNLATVVNFGLLFYVTAVFANIGLGGNTALLKSPSAVLVVIFIGLANLNIRRYGELVVPILLVFGAINVTTASQAMGVSGFALIVLSVVGAACLIDLGRVKTALLSAPG